MAVNKAKFEQLKASLAAGTIGHDALGLRSRKGIEKNTFVKDKTVPNTTGRRVFALQLSFPFNPFNPSDPSFNNSTKFYWDESPSAFVEMLKEYLRMKDNEDASEEERAAAKELYNFYNGLGEFKDAEGNPVDYDISKDEITKQDWILFKRYRDILVYKVLVFKTRLFNPKYERTFLSEAVVDPETGAVEGDGDTAYQLHRLVTDIAAKQVEIVKAKYEPGGELYGKPEADTEKEIKDIWRGRCITRPVIAGVARCLVFETEESSVETDTGSTDCYKVKEAKQIKETGLAPYERYTSGSEKALTPVRQILGKADDKHFDYVEVDIKYPAATGDNAKDNYTAACYAYGNREIVGNIPKPTTTDISDFDKIYREFRDDTETRFTDKFILNKVREFSRCDPDRLIKAAAEWLNNAEVAKLVDSDTLDRNKVLVDKLTPELPEEALALLDSAPSGNEKQQETMKKIITDFESTEEPANKVHGIDMVEAEEHGVSLTDLEVEGTDGVVID